jgi:hypothetical protein
MKTTKELLEDSRFSGRDLKAGTIKYEAGMLATQSQHSNLKDFYGCLGC